MPIKPPNLDDRRYDDIVREARALIPQYCPEWTNLSDADPGMTLVQLFAWMTEMTIFRLNRVPDKTYVHFLNFIGEERRAARPAMVPVTFSLATEGQTAVEIPACTVVSSAPEGGREALSVPDPTWADRSRRGHRARARRPGRARPHPAGDPVRP